MGRERDQGQKQHFRGWKQMFSEHYTIFKALLDCCSANMLWTLRYFELNYQRGVLGLSLHRCIPVLQKMQQELKYCPFLVFFFRLQDELGWFHQYESQSGMGLSVAPSGLCTSIWRTDWLQLFLGRTVKWTKISCPLLFSVFCCFYVLFMVYISVHGVNIWEGRIPDQKYHELNKTFYFHYVRRSLVFAVKSKADIPP